MQALPEDDRRVDHASPIDPSSSFFMTAALNESARRATWDHTWSTLGMVSSSYLSNVAALSAEQATIFEHNLGVSLVGLVLSTSSRLVLNICESSRLSFLRRCLHFFVLVV
jgi:hypothetical protein